MLPLHYLALLASFTPIPKPDMPPPLDCTVEHGISAADAKEAQRRWARYLGRKVEEDDEIAPGVKMRFTLVPPGKYLMGSPEGEVDRREDEMQHSVTISRPFYLGIYPVTQAEYLGVTGKNPSRFQGLSLPVEQVSWEEATAFARKVSGKTKYRLPTEGEWEYACRAGRPSSMVFGIGDGRSLSSAQANFNGAEPYGNALRAPNKTPVSWRSSCVE